MPYFQSLGNEDTPENNVSEAELATANDIKEEISQRGRLFEVGVLQMKLEAFKERVVEHDSRISSTQAPLRR